MGELLPDLSRNDKRFNYCCIAGFQKRTARVANKLKISLGLTVINELIKKRMGEFWDKHVIMGKA